MADEVKNFFLINAPAGSGKTTLIKSMVRNFILENPEDNILCITYTNRAAAELSSGLQSDRIFTGTIHSFLHSFMRRYFMHADILNLYFECYGEKIQQQIEHVTNDMLIADRNKKYEEKFGRLDYETVRNNITRVYYNESPFNSLFYGGLSHVDLINFSKRIFDRFPVIRRRISARYQTIFIDEYQDAMTDVLNIFYDAVEGTNSTLYLFGDRMQQIYLNYDGSFEERFKMFETEKMTTNYRSVKEIVDLLNRLYHDPELIQHTPEKTKLEKPDFPPRVVITNNMSTTLDKLQEEDPDTLVLYLFNAKRFTAIGAAGLYDAFSKMTRYSFGNRWSAVDVLTAPYEENPDPLLKLLYCVGEMAKDFSRGRYGPIIQTLKSNKAMFLQETCAIKDHSGKIRLFQAMKQSFDTFQDETKTISELLSILVDASLVDRTYVENILADEDNEPAFKVSAIELMRVLDYLDNPKVSTQHGVKGESYDSVIFVAEDGHGTPTVHTYRFFELMSQMQISLQSFNEFYYAYAGEITDLQSIIQMRISELKRDSYRQHENEIIAKAKTIADRFSDNPYFQRICKDDYTAYLNKPGVTNAKKCMKESKVLGILSAYKLFYVGCSRARKNLTILLDVSKMQGNIPKQKEMFQSLGFSVWEDAE